MAYREQQHGLSELGTRSHCPDHLRGACVLLHLRGGALGTDRPPVRPYLSLAERGFTSGIRRKKIRVSRRVRERVRWRYEGRKRRKMDKEKMKNGAFIDLMAGKWKSNLQHRKKTAVCHISLFPMCEIFNLKIEKREIVTLIPKIYMPASKNCSLPNSSVKNSEKGAGVGCHSSSISRRSRQLVPPGSSSLQWYVWDILPLSINKCISNPPHQNYLSFIYLFLYFISMGYLL